MHGWELDPGWHMGGMWIVWLLGLVLAGLVVWLLVRAGIDRTPRDESADEILKRRYASGEIDRETYERMSADLRK